jgi:uncharacterized protein (TIGR02145 family)
MNTTQNHSITRSGKARLPLLLALIAIVATAGAVAFYLYGNRGGGVEQSETPTTETPATFTDTRDGKTYKTVKIGKQTWMAENLNYAAEGSKCYVCEIYGRHYNWNVAMTACPMGWHLPSDGEWQILVDLGGGEAVAGKKLKSASGWDIDSEGNFYNGNGTDDYGFLALPGGLGDSYGGFGDSGFVGYWWTATESSASDAYYRSLGSSRADVGRHDPNKTIDLLSVRCVQNSADETEAEALARATAQAEASMAIAAEMAAATAAAAAKAAAGEIVSCGSKGGSGDVKLLECLNDCDKKFEYDEQNRIVKICNVGAITTITYAKDLVTVEIFYNGNRSTVEKFVRKGNTITLTEEGPNSSGKSGTLTVNEDGYMVSEEYRNRYMVSNKYVQYQYQNGNLINNDNSSRYSYDDKKSPYSNTSTPKWLLQHLLGSSSADKNNLLEVKNEDTLFLRNTYEYDSDGFPTKCTEELYEEGEKMKHYDSEGEEMPDEITRFTYYKAGEQK